MEYCKRTRGVARELLKAISESQGWNLAILRRPWIQKKVYKCSLEIYTQTIHSQSLQWVSHLILIMASCLSSHRVELAASNYNTMGYRSMSMPSLTPFQSTQPINLRFQPSEFPSHSFVMQFFSLSMIVTLSFLCSIAKSSFQAHFQNLH